MTRYIDCDKCYHGKVCAYRHHYHDMITDCNHYKPTADVVEVVRCKDCTEWNKDYRFCKRAGVDAYGSSPFWEESFCSCGKRRDTE